MKYIAFPIEEIDTVMKICVGQVNWCTDMMKDEEKNGVVLQMMKAKWEGKVEALQEMKRYGKECEEIK